MSLAPAQFFQTMRDDAWPTNCSRDFFLLFRFSYILKHAINLSRRLFFYVWVRHKKNRLAFVKLNWIFCKTEYSIVKVLDHWQLGENSPGSDFLKFWLHFFAAVWSESYRVASSKLAVWAVCFFRDLKGLLNCNF